MTAHPPMDGSTSSAQETPPTQDDTENPTSRKEQPMTEESEITLKRIERRIIEIRVEGTAPLIMSRFSEKAKQQMLDAQMGKTRPKKEPKDPEQDYQRSTLSASGTNSGVRNLVVPKFAMNC